MDENEVGGRVVVLIDNPKKKKKGAQAFSTSIEALLALIAVPHSS